MKELYPERNDLLESIVLQLEPIIRIVEVVVYVCIVYVNQYVPTVKREVGIR